MRSLKKVYYIVFSSKPNYQTAIFVKVWGSIMATMVAYTFMGRAAFAVPQEFLLMNALEENERKIEDQSPITLPRVDYLAGGLRDPFLPAVTKPTHETTPKKEQVREAEASLPSLSIQGVVWGGAAPQAIINNKVVKVGDSIEGAKVNKITREGIELIFNNRIFNIASPSSIQQSVSQKKPEGG